MAERCLDEWNAESQSLLGRTEHRRAPCRRVQPRQELLRYLPEDVGQCQIQRWREDNQSSQRAPCDSQAALESVREDVVDDRQSAIIRKY